MTFDDLLEAGYRPFPAPRHLTFCTRAAQKIVWSPDGFKQYFTNVFESSWPDGHVSMYAEVHFYDGLGGPSGSFRVERSVEELSAAQMEAFFADIYDALDCIPDALNND